MSAFYQSIKIVETYVSTPQVTDPITGKFVPGNKANPNGNNGRLKGYQPYAVRLLNLSEQYDSYQLLALYNDKSRFGKLNPLDSACISHLVDMIYGKSRGEALERALTRLEGAPKGSGAIDLNVNVNGEVTHTHEIGQQTRELIGSRIAGIASRGGMGKDLRRTEPVTIDSTPV